MVEKIIVGIILNKFDFEDEHLIKVITDNGRVLNLKAKGLNKLTSKNRISLSPFNICEIEYFTSGMGNGGRIKRSTMIKEFLNEDQISFSVLCLARNILEISTYNNVLNYLSLIQILSNIENNNYKFQDILCLMIIILKQEGYKPEVSCCCKCGTIKNINGFSLYENGLICDKHSISKKYEMKPNLLRKIIEINSMKNPILCRDLFFTPEEIVVLKSMYKLFFENQLGANLYLINKI